MDCSDIQPLIGSYGDGELDLVRSLEVEQHLRTCSACATRYENQQTLAAAISRGSLYHQEPPHLRQRIESALPRPGLPPTSRPRPQTIWPVSPWRWLELAAPLACAASLLFIIRLQPPIIIRLQPPTPSPGVPVAPATSAATSEPVVAQEVLSSHLRSLLPNRLTDVPSTDQHTVKPWFSGKLDFSPPVEDLAAQGFPLVGGRLDYVDGRRVAALIYKRRKHFINLFIWPSAIPVPRTTTTQNVAASFTRQGYNLVHWGHANMTYWLVSDVSASELQTLARLLQGPAPGRSASNGAQAHPSPQG